MGKILNNKENLDKINKIRYSNLVVKYIRERYSLDDEIAIQRQKETKPFEWQEYNEYCEYCKEQAKEFLEKL